MRDAPGQPFGDGGFAHAGLTHQQGVVLAATTQDLNDPLHLVFAANQRIDLAILGHLVEVLGELLERRSFLVLLAAASLFLFLRRGLGTLGGLGGIALLDAVSNEVHHIQACDTLLVQVVHGMRVLFAEDGHQHIGTGHFLFAIARGLHMHDGALDDALKPQGGLGIDLVGARDLGGVVFDEVGQRLAQIVDVGRTRA